MPGRLRRVGRHALALARAAAPVIALVLAVRALCRDRWPWSELLFHIPAPLLFLAGLGAVLAWLPRWRGFGLLLAALLAAFLPGFVLFEQPNLLRAPTPPAPRGEPVRITFWNVMSYNLGEDLVTDLFAADDPDIVCLLEGTYRGNAPDFLRKRMGREYQWAGTRQMAVGSRFPLREWREFRTESGLRAFVVSVAAPAGVFTLLLVDCPAPPRRRTAEVFTDLWAEIAAVEGPLVLIGDLNTARGSWHAARATQALDDAFLASSSAPRWLATWPSRVPLYQLDHAFVSPGFRVVSADLPGDVASDHLRVRLHLLLPETKGARGTNPPRP